LAESEDTQSYFDHVLLMLTMF